MFRSATSANKLQNFQLSARCTSTTRTARAARTRDARATLPAELTHAGNADRQSASQRGRKTQSGESGYRPRFENDSRKTAWDPAIFMGRACAPIVQQRGTRADTFIQRKALAIRDKCANASVESPNVFACDMRRMASFSF